MVEAVAAGQRQGTAVVVYQGEMVDIAHLTYAKQMLALAEEDEAPAGRVMESAEGYPK